MRQIQVWMMVVFVVSVSLSMPSAGQSGIDEEEGFFGGDGGGEYGPDEYKEKRDEHQAEHERERQLLEDYGVLDRYSIVYLYDDSRHALYQEKDFEKVERQVAQYFSGAEDPLKVHRYSNLMADLGTWYYNEKPETNLRVLDEWVEAHPESYRARLVRGLFYVDYAWYFRGTAYARKVSDKSFEQFDRYLRLAKEDLDAAHEMNPNDPEASIGLIDVAGGSSMSDSAMRGYFDRATELVPFHIGAHYAYANFIQPKWGGSIRELRAFVAEAEKNAQAFPYLMFGVREFNQYLYRADGMTKEQWDALRLDPKWVEAFERQLELNPGDLHVMTAIAYWAYETGDYERADKYFDIIGDRYIMRGSLGSLYDHVRLRSNTKYRIAVKHTGSKFREWMRQAVEIMPYGASARYMYGVSLTYIKEWELAREQFEVALAIKPDFVRVLVEMANLCKQTEEYEEALKHAEHALRTIEEKDLNVSNETEKRLNYLVRASKRGLR